MVSIQMGVSKMRYIRRKGRVNNSVNRSWPEGRCIDKWGVYGSYYIVAKNENMLVVLKERRISEALDRCYHQQDF